jgi:hypothetical protein
MLICYTFLFSFLKVVEYLCSNMFRQEYEECLLCQLSIKEGRPFQAALPVSAGFSGSSSAVGPDMAAATKKVGGNLL